MDEREKSDRFLFWFAVGALLLLVLYFGTYAVVAQKKVYRLVGVDPLTRQNIFVIDPAYRSGGGWLETFLEPAHWIDRVLLRYEFWTTIQNSDGIKWTNPVPKSSGKP